MRQQMTTHRHTAMTVASETFEGLVVIASAALRDCFPNTRFNLDEVQALVDALSLLAPAHSKAKFARATLHVVKQDWQEAVSIYRELVDAAECLPQSQAMLAYALNQLQDPEWRANADSLRDSGDAGVSYLARSMIAKDSAEPDIGPFQPDDNRTAAQPVEGSAAKPADGTASSPDGTPAADGTAPPDSTKSPNSTTAPAWVNYGLRA